MATSMSLKIYRKWQNIPSFNILILTCFISSIKKYYLNDQAGKSNKNESRGKHYFFTKMFGTYTTKKPGKHLENKDS